MFEQTVRTQIKLLVKEQFDLDLHYANCHLTNTNTYHLVVEFEEQYSLTAVRVKVFKY